MKRFKLRERGILTALCAAFILAGCTKAPEDAARVTSGAVQTASQSEVTVYETQQNTENEEDEKMSIYKIKTFDTVDAVDWDSVTPAEVNTYKWVECETYSTTAKLVYVKGYGFLCRMECAEESPVATYTNFDDPVCLDSCLEFFAIWDNESENYLNIETNSIGTMCIGFGPSRESRRTALRYLPLEDMFRMNPVVEDGKWSVTMDIPLEKLRKFYKNITADTFVSGYTFTGNFYKTGGADNTGNEHYAMWHEINTEHPDFHRPEQFGTFIIE